MSLINQTKIVRPLEQPGSAVFIIALCSAFLLSAISDAHAEGASDSVVVVYNSRMRESKEVAEYYAQRRRVPSSQVLGFSLPEIETISRGDYRDRLEQPLLAALKSKGLFRLGPEDVQSTNGTVQHFENKVLVAKIRYLVLCYGVPVGISHDASLREKVSPELPANAQRNDAAIDSELACLPLVGQNYVRLGPMPNPHYGVTNASRLDPVNGILLVARLDGPTAAIARGLVDKALQAETNGLWGRAYFDLRGLPAGNEYKLGDDFIHGASEAARVYGFETVVDDNPGTFPPSFPLSNVALYAGWYDEHISGPFTLPRVEFMPGAFAYHLHSFSAAGLRSTNGHWTGPLLSRGITATFGTVQEPYLVGTPNVAVFFQRFLGGFTFGEAAYACQCFLSWQTTVVGDPLYRPFGKSPLEQVRELEQQHSKYLDWAVLRLANVALVNHEPVTNAIARLETLPLTRQSPVLSEKLAELYQQQDKQFSSIAMLEQVLKLDPSPQQRIRVMQTLAARLLAQDRNPEAYAVYQQFVDAFPEYPDRTAILRQLVTLAQKLGKSEDAAKYDRGINQPPPPKPQLPKGPPLRPGI